MEILKSVFRNPKAAVKTRNRKMDDESLESYDLVTIVFESGKTQSAWWTGNGWDGYKKIIEPPVFWRKRHDR